MRNDRDHLPAILWISLFVMCIVIAVVSNVSDKQNCDRRGGVMHCTEFTGWQWAIMVDVVTSENCDCYWPDGRVMIR